VSHEMIYSRERRLFSWSNATCAMPLCEALSSRRGRGPHHAHKDRVGTWDISLQYIPRVADQAVLTRAMIKDMFWATCISISVVSALNVLLWVWGAL
jgi:hypothetical protein